MGLVRHRKIRHCAEFTAITKPPPEQSTVKQEPVRWLTGIPFVYGGEDVKYTLPLPEVHRQFEHVKVINLLKTLAGDAFVPMADPVRRKVAFKPVIKLNSLTRWGHHEESVLDWPDRRPLKNDDDLADDVDESKQLSPSSDTPSEERITDSDHGSVEQDKTEIDNTNINADNEASEHHASDKEHGDTDDLFVPTLRSEQDDDELPGDGSDLLSNPTKTEQEETRNDKPKRGRLRKRKIKHAKA